MGCPHTHTIGFPLRGSFICHVQCGCLQLLWDLWDQWSTTRYLQSLTSERERERESIDAKKHLPAVVILGRCCWGWCFFSLTNWPGKKLKNPNIPPSWSLFTTMVWPVYHRLPSFGNGHVYHPPLRVFNQSNNQIKIWEKNRHQIQIPKETKSGCGRCWEKKSQILLFRWNSQS